MKAVLSILSFFLLISIQSNGQEIESEFVELNAQIDSIIQANNFNGVVLISSGSKEIYSKAAGYSDLENKTKIDINDQFVIGSISKQITAVLILREYEKGKIGLNDPISTFLSEIEQPWADEVTIHHLLTHTHGIVDVDQALEFEQGSQFHYSQLGYDLLAQILEKVTQKSFKDLSTELFEKYKLKNTFHPENKAYENLVKGYEEGENGILEFAEGSLDNFVAAGSFISNASDLKRWNEILHRNKLVKKETLKLMKTNFATRIHPIFETVQYGYGLLFKEGEEDIQIGALGYAPGFVSACYYYPKTKYNLIVLSNTAMNLDDFKKTFVVHTELMELLKKEGSND